MASFGDSLRRERELRGIDLRDVADATKISLRFLQALENDRVDILPGGIFPRAFVRQYAAYLGLDVDRKVAEFLYHVGNESPAPTAPPRARSRAPAVALLVLVISALALAGVWGFTRWRERPADGAAVTPPASTFAPDRVYPPPTPTVPVAAAALVEGQGLVLSLNARQTCWVAVQADGKKVVDRVMTEGETESVTATSELVLSVGNAGGISFTVNGRPGISLGDEGVVRRNILISRQSLPSLLQESPAGPASSAGTFAAPASSAPPRPRPRRAAPSPADTSSPTAAPATPPTPVPSPDAVPPPERSRSSLPPPGLHG